MRRIVIALILLGVACESGTAPLAPNDTVSETIDTPADVDDFRFIGTAGQIVNLFLQQLGTSNRNLRADLSDDEAPLPPSQPPLPPFPVAVDFGVVPNADLEAAASGLYTLTASGHYRIRVYTNGFAGADTAAVPYHMQLYVVDTLPEHANPRIPSEIPSRRPSITSATSTRTPSVRRQARSSTSFLRGPCRYRT